MKKLHKILAMLLIACLLVGNVNITSFAEGQEKDDNNINENTNPPAMLGRIV